LLNRNLRLFSGFVSNVLTLVNSALLQCLFLASLGNTLLIGCDRFVATTRPTEYRKLVSIRRVCGGILINWIALGFVIGIPMILHNLQQDLNIRVVYVLDVKIAHPKKYVEYVVDPLTFAMMLCNCILYSVILFKFYRISQRLPTSSTREIRSRKLTATVVTVVLITLVLWAPTVFFCLLPIEPGEVHSLRGLVYRIGLVMLIISSYLNNVIYAMRQPDYKLAYRRLLRCRKTSVHPETTADPPV
jgi:hypothetical protein